MYVWVCVCVYYAPHGLIHIGIGDVWGSNYTAKAEEVGFNQNLTTRLAAAVRICIHIYICIYVCVGVCVCVLRATWVNTHWYWGCLGFELYRKGGGSWVQSQSDNQAGGSGEDMY